LQFACDYLNWTTAQWTRITFSDEKKF
jgi:hypothetical protein